jgi:chemotaxis protein MotB
MIERIVELEQQLETWERRNRVRTLSFALVPVLVAAALAWFAESQIDLAERGQADALRRAVASEQALAETRTELGRLRAVLAESEHAAGGELVAERERRTRAEADLAGAREEAARLRTSLDEAQAALAAATAEADRRQADTAAAATALAAERDGARAALDEARARTEALEQEAAGLRARLTTAEAALDEARTRLAAPAEQPSDIAEQATRLARLETELDQAGREIEALRATGAEMDRAIAARDEALAGLRREGEARLEAATRRAEELAQTREGLAAERDETLRRAESAEGRLAQAEEARKSAEERAEALAGQLAGAETAAKESDAARVLEAEQRERLAAERLALEEQIKALKGELATAVRAAAVISLPAREEARSAPEPAAPPAATTLLAGLRERLADASGVQIVDDRLVLGAGALFAPGRAELSPSGRAELEAVAARLRGFVDGLPAGTAWTLRVEGHTDDTPVRRSPFPSNQALSEARARAVADHLAGAGLPMDRLVVSGLADRQPLVPGRSEEARSRNRRIELRLTSP